MLLVVPMVSLLSLLRSLSRLIVKQVLGQLVIGLSTCLPLPPAVLSLER